MLHFVSEVSRNHFLKENNLIYYKIHGGLGNQLFGLSSAYQLYKTTSKKIAIDVTNLDHTSQGSPDWSHWHEIRAWAEIFTQSEDISLPKTTWNLIRPIDIQTESSDYFTGWRLSLNDVLQSGLFREGQCPYVHSHEQQSGIAIHMRGGDYRNAVGIGLLHSSYYRRAIDALGGENGKEITIFTDDLEYARSIEGALRLASPVKYSQSSSAFEVMAEMSSYESLIGSNSTLSWWSAFFSRSAKICMPQPMYLQDWHADHEIHLDKAQYLSRFPNKISESYQYFLWKYLRA